MLLLKNCAASSGRRNDGQFPHDGGMPVFSAMSVSNPLSCRVVPCRPWLARLAGLDQRRDTVALPRVGSTVTRANVRPLARIMTLSA